MKTTGRVRALQIVAAPTPTPTQRIGVNGPERRAANVVRDWVGQGVDAVVAYPRRGRLWEHFATSGCALEDFEISGKEDLGAIVRIRRMIRAYKAQVVHTQGPESLDAIAAWAAKLSGLPFLVTRPLTSDQLVHRQRYRVPVYRLVDDITLGIARHVISVSQAGFDTLSRSIKRAPDKVRLIYNGVNLARFQHPSQRAQSDAAVRIGMVAQLTPPKGWDDFVEVIGNLVERGANVQALVIGDGPQRADIARLVRVRNLESCVTLIGHTDNVAEVLRSLDIFLLTSHREGLSVAVLEAMASGLPIVGTDVGGTREQVVDGLNGYVAASGDVRTLADRTMQLVQSCKLRAQFGAASRVRAEKMFSQDRMVAMYADLYRASLS